MNNLFDCVIEKSKNSNNTIPLISFNPPTKSQTHNRFVQINSHLLPIFFLAFQKLIRVFFARLIDSLETLTPLT